MPADVLPPLQRLSALGQSVWLDFLSRDVIRGGHLQELIDDFAGPFRGRSKTPAFKDRSVFQGQYR